MWSTQMKNVWIQSLSLVLVLCAGVSAQAKVCDAYLKTGQIQINGRDARFLWSMFNSELDVQVRDGRSWEHKSSTKVISQYDIMFCSLTRTIQHLQYDGYHDKEISYRDTPYSFDNADVFEIFKRAGLKPDKKGAIRFAKIDLFNNQGKSGRRGRIYQVTITPN
jgi:hypothetical protein